ncbi:MAG: hypothetical protein RR415_08895 [Ruthenibacterium sp.]
MTENNEQLLSPSDLNTEAIMAWLKAIGLGNIVDSRMLAVKLHNVTERTIRNHAQCKKLKRAQTGSYIFRLEDVAAWLTQNPRYIAQSGEYWAVDEHTKNTIRKIVLNDWKNMTKIYELDDIVSEVVAYLLSKPKNTAYISTAIKNSLRQVWRRLKKENLHRTVSLDAIKERYGERDWSDNQ